MPQCDSLFLLSLLSSLLLLLELQELNMFTHSATKPSGNIGLFICIVVLSSCVRDHQYGEQSVKSQSLNVTKTTESKGRQ